MRGIFESQRSPACFWRYDLCGDQAAAVLSHIFKISARKGKLKITVWAPQYAQDFSMKNSSCFFPVLTSQLADFLLRGPTTWAYANRSRNSWLQNKFPVLQKKSLHFIRRDIHRQGMTETGPHARVHWQLFWRSPPAKLDDAHSLQHQHHPGAALSCLSSNSPQLWAPAPVPAALGSHHPKPSPYTNY